MPTTYPFAILSTNEEIQRPPEKIHHLLKQRPFITKYRAEPSSPTDSPEASGFGELETQANTYCPSDDLVTAFNMAIAVGMPLLLTGDPGTGKTTAAYFAARKLGLDLIHYQVKSSSRAKDLLYEFDNVRYFTDAQLQASQTGGELTARVRRDDYVRFRYLGEAIRSNSVKVLLIDEIDKAPRDFPNDLLLEIDKLCFEVPEIDQPWQQAPPERRPIVIITSNLERSLPEPFLRRCILHDIPFNKDLLGKIITNHFPEQSAGQVTTSEISQDKATERGGDSFYRATQAFLALRKKGLKKKPSTAELLVWLQLLLLPENKENEDLWKRVDAGNLGKLPFLGALLKHPEDLEAIAVR